MERTVGANTVHEMTVLAPVIGAVVDLDGRAHYIHSGWFLISVANLVVILAMIAVFVLAILLPFPGNRSEP
jgi:hypothetical protein